ncbi:MAG TPA: hypothetical protein VID30_07590, partial [Bradyrhizobium sp.]
VSDFKSGQIAQVMPGQVATSFANGKAGLSLSGSGIFNPIEQGRPRASSIERIPVPKSGLPAPHVGDGKLIHAVAPVDASSSKLANASTQQQPASESRSVSKNVVHISTALGEVRLNVNKATHGLAHGAPEGALVRNASRDTTSNTVWNDNKSSVSTASAIGQTGSNASGGNGSGNGGGSTASAVATTTAAAATTVGTTVAAVDGTVSDVVSGTSGVVNAAVGNGKGLGKALGLGNGNGGVGNGNGNGNAKH